MVEVMDRLRGPFVVRWLASSQADAQGSDQLRGPFVVRWLASSQADAQRPDRLRALRRAAVLVPHTRHAQGPAKRVPLRTTATASSSAGPKEASSNPKVGLWCELSNCWLPAPMNT